MSESKRMSDEAVRAKTGRTWDEWFAVLDAAGAATLDHKGIVAVLREQYGVGPWWQQMVTVQYERERGLRVKHETSDGYQVGASKTVGVPVSVLYHAWADEEARRRWLGDVALTVRKSTPDRSLRITWPDGRTNVEVNLYAKGDAKSQVSVEHRKLADAQEAARMKAYWGEAVARLKQTLES